MDDKQILEVRNISKNFIIERGLFKSTAGFIPALVDISFRMNEFDSLGIAGESGSGKTTLAKIILGLVPATVGAVAFNSAKIIDPRKDVQIIFQNPYNSLNPKMRVVDMLIEPLWIHRIVPKKLFRQQALELLQMVGLDAGALTRYPREFSGGQRQRLCIARALASFPRFLVLDEPISSLDLTIQTEMLKLFRDLKQRFNLTYIFISHNLAVIKHIATSVMIMQNGRIVEQGSTEDLFSHPQQAYTKLLLDSARG